MPGHCPDSLTRSGKSPSSADVGLKRCLGARRLKVSVVLVDSGDGSGSAIVLDENNGDGAPGETVAQRLGDHTLCVITTTKTGAGLIGGLLPS
jgi:predicted neutral ceramidase superfamily lipid hydrolase